MKFRKISLFVSKPATHCVLKIVQRKYCGVFGWFEGTQVTRGTDMVYHCRELFDEIQPRFFINPILSLENLNEVIGQLRVKAEK